MSELRVALFVVLINWLCSLHIQFAISNDKKIKVISLVLSVVFSICLGLVTIW